MNNALVKHYDALPVSVGSEAAYMASISQIPILSADEEYNLAVQLRDENDIDSAKRLIMSHLRFVAHIAKGYTGYGLALADLIQEGNVGLMKAVKRFDPEMKVRLISFAVHWIRAEIHEYVIKNWRIVKIATTKAQRKLFFKLRGSKKRLAWLNQEEVNTVANDLGVKPETVLEMEKRLSAQDLGFDASDYDDDSSTAPAAYLTNQHDEPSKLVEEAEWQETNLNALQSALGNLDERSQDILAQRWLSEDKATLHELADKYGVSAERIRQLENNALKKLKAVMVA